MNIRKLNIIVACLLAFLFPAVALAQDSCSSEGSRPKYVALSFDDGPSLKYTPMMLDVLTKRRPTATLTRLALVDSST